MRIGIYFCDCGPNVSEKIDAAAVRGILEAVPGFAYFRTAGFLCAAEGVSAMEKEIREERPDRVVVAACSVRDHEETFRAVLARAGMNPFLMQMVNVREHIAWVTDDTRRATEKAARSIAAALRRVALHEPLARREIDVNTDVLVIGAGPAGLSAARTCAEAGRKVVLVEKAPVLGGLPARYEEMFPDMECGPCLLEPVLADILHGSLSEHIEVLTLSEVTGVVGRYGSYRATIRRSPRHVSPSQCIACGECIPACPVVYGNPYQSGRSERRAIDFPFRGGLPNLPYIDPDRCRRTAENRECTLCRDACLVDGAIDYAEAGETIEREVGGIVIATGAGLFDCAKLENLGHGRFPDVVTSLEFERLLAANGPTGGAIRRADGAAPKRISIVHCAGSLDPRHREYCSGVCCQTAFKFNRLIAEKSPGTEVTHYCKAVSVPGKGGYRLYEEARARPTTRFVQYRDIDEIEVWAAAGGGNIVVFRGGEEPSSAEADIVVLCPALVPSEGTARAAEILDVGTDRFGFLEELHGRTDPVRSKVRGICIAGACQAPMDTQKAVEQGIAAAGVVLSGLVPGRKLLIEPVVAVVDGARCSGCRSCLSVCPARAISFDPEKDAAAVDGVLCLGCGTCVAACPAGAVKGNHFTNEQLFAEISEVLS